MATRTALLDALLVAFEQFDYLALPTAQCFPFDISLPWPRHVNGVEMDSYHRWMEVVVAGSMSGCPVLNIPAGFGHEGLPMGLQLIGRPRDDLSLIRLAASMSNSYHGSIASRTS